MCHPTIVVLLLLLFSVAAPADAHQRHMGWGDGIAGAKDASPNCDNLTASHTLVISFTAPPDISEVQRIDAFVDFCTDPSALLEWWRFDAGSGCRAGSLEVSADFTSGPFTGHDPWNGGAEVTASYHPAFGGNPVLARVNVTVIPTAGTGSLAAAGQEIYAFKLIFKNPAQGCGGCEQQACFVVNGLSITHPGGVYYTDMTYSNYVTWHGGQRYCPFIVPARRISWSRLKASYD